MTSSPSQPIRLESADSRGEPASNSMSDADLLSAIAEVRAQELSMLTALPAAQWELPTLCDGWRVREVVAHQTMPFRYSGSRIALELLKSMGQFNRMADRIAKRDAAALSIEEQLAAIRDNLNNPWKPPGGGLRGALCHDVIHGLDIATPLGLELHIPHKYLRLSIDQVAGRARNPFGTDLDGTDLRADDCDWTIGSGTPLHGSTQDLLLVYCGRKLPIGRVKGELAYKFTTGGTR
jgi:uncharacterized protein (TIGR03083 family)